MYIEDLTVIKRLQYGWINGPLAIGWLDHKKPFPTGDAPKAFLQQLRLRVEKPIFLTRGFHRCPWCPEADENPELRGNGEICIQGSDHRWYCAPQLVAHYVEHHHYLPPESFIQAVLEPNAIHDGQREWRKISESDLSFIKVSLGREPRETYQIAGRRLTGCPVVISNQPIQQRQGHFEPFPTFYWLVDPEINTRIADIERKGGVAEIESFLMSDEQLMQNHLAENRAYAQARWAVLTAEDVRLAKQRGFMDALDKTGIGGVANHRAVKCLHAQYAFHLVREGGTTVGRLMEERFGIRFDA